MQIKLYELDGGRSRMGRTSQYSDSTGDIGIGPVERLRESGFGENLRPAKSGLKPRKGEALYVYERVFLWSAVIKKRELNEEPALCESSHLMKPQSAKQTWSSPPQFCSTHA